MGNQLFRRRDTPTGAETADTEKTPAETPAVTPDAETVETPVDINNLIVGGEVVEPEVCFPGEPCTLADPVPLIDVESESVARDISAPVQTEPLVSVSEPSLAEAPLAPEVALEPIPGSESILNTEAEVEAGPESTESSPAEDLEPQTNMITQESVPEPEISSPALIDEGVSDAIPPVIDTPPSSPPIPDPVNGEEPSDIPVADRCHDTAEIPPVSTLDSDMSEETLEPVEKLTDMLGDAGNLEQIVSDVTEENVSELLENLKLTGNDIVTDPIPTDTKIPDDAPAELM